MSAGEFYTMQHQLHLLGNTVPNRAVSRQRLVSGRRSTHLSRRDHLSLGETHRSRYRWALCCSSFFNIKLKMHFFLTLMGEILSFSPFFFQCKTWNSFMQTYRQQCYQLLLRELQVFHARQDISSLLRFWAYPWDLLSWECQKHLSDEVSWWHPDQMPASPNWALLEAKEQWLEVKSSMDV